MMLLLQALYLASAERYCRHGSYRRQVGRTLPSGSLNSGHTSMGNRWNDYLADVDTCAFDCRLTHECVAWAYNRITKLCTHLDVTGERDHYVVDEGGEGDYVYGDDDDACMANPLRQHGKTQGEVCSAAYKHPRYGHVSFTGIVDKYGTCVESRDSDKLPDSTGGSYRGPKCNWLTDLLGVQCAESGVTCDTHPYLVGCAPKPNCIAFLPSAFTSSGRVYCPPTSGSVVRDIINGVLGALTTPHEYPYEMIFNMHNIPKLNHLSHSSNLPSNYIKANILNMYLDQLQEILGDTTCVCEAKAIFRRTKDLSAYFNLTAWIAILEKMEAANAYNADGLHSLLSLLRLSPGKSILPGKSTSYALGYIAKYRDVGYWTKSLYCAVAYSGKNRTGRMLIIPSMLEGQVKNYAALQNQLFGRTCSSNTIKSVYTAPGCFFARKVKRGMEYVDVVIPYAQSRLNFAWGWKKFSILGYTFHVPYPKVWHGKPTRTFGFPAITMVYSCHCERHYKTKREKYYVPYFKSASGYYSKYGETQPHVLPVWFFVFSGMESAHVSVGMKFRFRTTSVARKVDYVQRVKISAPKLTWTKNHIEVAKSSRITTLQLSPLNLNRTNRRFFIYSPNFSKVTIQNAKRLCVRNFPCRDYASGLVFGGATQPVLKYSVLSRRALSEDPQAFAKMANSEAFAGVSSLLAEEDQLKTDQLSGEFNDEKKKDKTANSVMAVLSAVLLF